MKPLMLAFFAAAALVATITAASTYTVAADWLKLPQGREQLGNQHGDMAVSSTGEVYVSVQDPAGGSAGLLAGGRVPAQRDWCAERLSRLRDSQAGRMASSSTAPRCADRRSSR